MPQPTATRRRARAPRMTAHCPLCGREHVPAAPGPTRCGHCDECCTCGGTSPSHTKEWSQHAANFAPGEADGLIRRYASAEIEFNGMARYGSHLTDLVYRKQHGHTLRDGSCGWEINTAPARGVTYVEHVRAICALLEAGKVRLDRRCGLHVHVNVGGLPGRTAHLTTSEGTTDFRGLLRIALLWARVEKAIQAMVSDSRLDNTYCQFHGDHFVNLVARRAREAHAEDIRNGDAIAACYAAERFTEADAQWVIDYGLYGVTGSAADSCRRSKNPHSDHAYWKNSARTGALNLHSVFFHGTVEARIHQGTANADKIIYWTGLVVGLVDYALSHTPTEIAQLRGTPAEIIDRAVANPEVTAWRKTRFAHFYEKRSAARHGGAASAGAVAGARRRRTGPATPVVAPPVVPEASEQ